MISLVDGHTDADCSGYFGPADLAVYISGQTLPYTYQWTGPGGYTCSGTNTQLTATIPYCGFTLAGVYTVSVRDTNGLTASLSITFNIPSPVVITITNKTGCCPGGTGGFTFAITGGTAPYTYSVRDTVTNTYVIPKPPFPQYSPDSGRTLTGLNCGPSQNYEIYACPSTLGTTIAICNVGCFADAVVPMPNTNCGSCYQLTFCSGSQPPVIIENPVFSGSLGTNPISYVGRCFQAIVQPPGSLSIPGCFCLTSASCIPPAIPIPGYSIAVSSIYNSCSDCIGNLCWQLTSCTVPGLSYQVNTDLTVLDGSVINNVVFTNGSPTPVADPLACWTVSSIGICHSTLQLLSYGTIYPDCNCCLPFNQSPEPLPPRVYPLPVKNFTQVLQSKCDIDVAQSFSDGFYSLVKQERYGVTDCCTSWDLEALWLSKEISELECLGIPGFVCRQGPPCNFLPMEPCELLADTLGGVSIIGIAGENLGFGLLVELAQDGTFYLNDPTDLTTYQRVAGFTLQSVIAGQMVKILVSGIFINPNWTLQTGTVYYSAPGGLITTSLPVHPMISQVIGVSKDIHSLMVTIDDPVII